MKNYEIVIASVPDRDLPAAEIWFGFLLATIFFEGEELKIEFYPNTHDSIFDLPLADVIEALEEAKRRI